ncbi:hypothetical protein EV702DRAFT_1195022 [Suillus placidus]|uniref:Uncharacterized protein n=1 Tax=Suillus placidus TaxID=48579 RepID=A0A9P6ZZF2_9AGAM|nr:hypothetical protein EV702DRAFT_1195022 [Suillus placidus]
MAVTTPKFDHQAELLKRSVPIWPTQLRWYTERALPESLSCDYIVQEMQVDLAQREVCGNWEESTHPSGATYYYNAKMMTYTEMNLRTCSDKQLQRLESWINTSRAKLCGNPWSLVVEPILARGQEIYPYYYVVPEKRIITWLEPVDAYLLFQECTAVLHWNHKRLELEAQFWKHVEYFPFEIKSIYVDGLISGVDIRRFTDDFSAQAKAQATVASVIMAVDASILAIPGLGSQLATKALCSVSFILSVYCIIGCTIAQQFSSRSRSLDFAVYYLQGKLINLVILASIPSFLYLTSLLFSILGFLAGIFTIEFRLDLSAKIRCGLALIVGASLTIPLVIASFGPGLI